MSMLWINTVRQKREILIWHTQNDFLNQGIMKINEEEYYMKGVELIIYFPEFKGMKY